MIADHQHGDWRGGFLFVGNQLALDFMNTRPFVDGNFMELLPDVRALLRWFIAARLIDKRQAAQLERQCQAEPGVERALEAMRQFRVQLRRDVAAWVAGSAPRRG